MKKSLLFGASILIMVGALFAGAASAAGAEDITQSPDWSGEYWGVHVGRGTGEVSWTSASNNDLSGFVIGAHAGKNYQISSLVLGFEGDADYSTISSDGECPIIGAPPLNANCDLDYRAIFSIRGRAGIVQQQILPFVTLGITYSVVSVSDPEVTNIRAVGPDIGFVLGGGIELSTAYGYRPRIEALYYRFVFVDTLVVRAGISF